MKLSCSMLTVSLHGIRLHAKVGLYPEEKIHGNDFEIDVDVHIPVAAHEEYPYVDYAILHGLVLRAFQNEGDLLETLVKEIHGAVKEFVALPATVRVAIRKMIPPLSGPVAYSQVCYEG